MMNSLRVSCIAEKALLFLFTEQNLVPNDLFLRLVKELYAGPRVPSAASLGLPARRGPGVGVSSRSWAAAAAVLVLLAGCSGKPPVLSRVFGRVIYVHDAISNTNSETLGVYLVASDPDGMENLSSFYVINDDAELFWKVDSGTWVTSAAEGETWIGTTSLAMPGTSAIPAGQYRVVLQAKGSATVEQTLTVPSRDGLRRGGEVPDGCRRKRRHQGVGRDLGVRDLGVRQGREVRRHVLPGSRLADTLRAVHRGVVPVPDGRIHVPRLRVARRRGVWRALGIVSIGVVMEQCILALDQGTTSSRALVFDRSGRSLGIAQKPFRQIYPRPGWVEHDPLEIWETQLSAAREAIAEARIDPSRIAAIGIANQRETAVFWDRETGHPLGPALVWQDRRTADICRTLSARGPGPHDPRAHGAAARSLLLRDEDHVGAGERPGPARAGAGG